MAIAGGGRCCTPGLGSFEGYTSLWLAFVLRFLLLGFHGVFPSQLCVFWLLVELAETRKTSPKMASGARQLNAL
jgi:hypothetical protein